MQLALFDYIAEYQLIASAIIILIGSVSKMLLIPRLQQRLDSNTPSSRKLINLARNAISALIVIGLIAIWLSELRYLALSIATFMVALIIATREYIQCLVGSLYRSSTQIFTVGDWVKIGNYYGEVVSSDWLTTKLLEINMDHGSYKLTGNTVVLPNHYFINQVIINLNTMRRYVMHSFVVVRDHEGPDVLAIRDYLHQQVTAYYQPFQDTAERYASMIKQRTGVSISTEPSVELSTNHLGKNEWTLAIFCPTEAANNLQLQLTKDFIVAWDKSKAELAQAKTHKPKTTYKPLYARRHNNKD